MAVSGMCGLCLSETDRLGAVDRRVLQGVYEDLTGLTFETESRPRLACNVCSMGLKVCYHMTLKCLATEESFSRLLDIDHECKSTVSRKPFFGLTRSNVEHIHIPGPEERTASKRLAVVCERLPKKLLKKLESSTVVKLPLDEGMEQRVKPRTKRKLEFISHSSQNGSNAVAELADIVKGKRKKKL